ncbi:MAG: hypothetical protein U1E65_33010 [Myxococcota bacterium]
MSREKRLEEAAEHLRKARYPKAIDLYRQLLAEEPDNVELRTVLAGAYKKAKNSERAFHHYNKAATIYLQKNDHQNALISLENANELSPSTPEVLYRLCECLKVLGKSNELKRELVSLVRAAAAPGDRRRLWGLEELFRFHPDDLSVGQQRAEALAEADRIEDAVTAYKLLSAKLSHRGQEFVGVIYRAGQIASERPDLGADLASVLLVKGRTKEAMALILGFYERTPDDVGVLETLLRCLEALGATDKIIPARVELVKARARTGARTPTVQAVDDLLALVGDDPGPLEVAAHALALVREQTRAVELWRRLARVADRRGLKGERDRALASILSTNPDDEEGLEMAASAHLQAARFQEADAVRKRLAEVRALKKRSLTPQRVASKPPSRPPSEPPQLKTAPSPPPEDDFVIDEVTVAADPEEEPSGGTMVLSEDDVLLVRHHESGERLPVHHDPWRTDEARGGGALESVPLPRLSSGALAAAVEDLAAVIDGDTSPEAVVSRPKAKKARLPTQRRTARTATKTAASNTLDELEEFALGPEEVTSRMEATRIEDLPTSTSIPPPPPPTRRRTTRKRPGDSAGFDSTLAMPGLVADLLDDK